MKKSGASASGPPPAHRNVDGETFETLLTLKTLLPDEVTTPSPTGPNGPKNPKSSLLKASLNFQAALVADLISQRNFRDKDVWSRCVGAYMTPWLGEEKGREYAETARNHYVAIDEVCLFLILGAFIYLCRLNTLVLL